MKETTYVPEKRNVFNILHLYSLGSPVKEGNVANLKANIAHENLFPAP